MTIIPCFLLLLCRAFVDAKPGDELDGVRDGVAWCQHAQEANKSTERTSGFFCRCPALVLVRFLVCGLLRGVCHPTLPLG